jgi:pimeloyl-ACP methyl ester carboxylesterase
MSILLVHGAWHGAWCWDLVRVHLEDATAIDLPSNHGSGGFAGDVAAVRSTLDRMPAPVTVVGHSYGGAVISEAGTHPSVGHLVVIAGFALATGETVTAHGAPPAPPTALSAAVRLEGMDFVVDADGARVAFYADCDQAPVDRLVPHPLDAFTTPVTEAAWNSASSTYVLCSQDQALHIDAQRFFATRCTITVELDASHSPMLSMPAGVAEILRRVGVQPPDQRS